MGCLSAQSESNIGISQERAEFLADFDRIGMNSTTDDARFLRMLVEMSGATRGLEVGSANGHGAMYMGLGFEETGGKLITIEIDEDLWRQCRDNIQAMSLGETVQCVRGDALEALSGWDQPLDFVFLDALKRDYFKYFRAVEDSLVPGAVIVADNAIRAADAMRDFLDYLSTSPDYEMLVIKSSDEKRDGMAVALKLP